MKKKMKQKTIVIIICIAFGILMLLNVLSAVIEVMNYDSSKCGENLTWSLSGDGVLTISGEGDMYDYDTLDDRGWKEEYSGGPRIVVIQEGVTSIGEGAFMGCVNIEEVTIPDSVTSIGEDAFFGCWLLEKIEISANVTEIEEQALYACFKMEEIVVSEDNPNYSSLNGVLFNKDKTELICYPSGLCDEIYYEVPESVTSIANYAFWDCNSYEAMCKLMFSGDAPSFGRKAFDGETVTIYYPEDNETWEKVIKKNFGGEITWMPYDPSEEDMEISGECGDNVTYTLSFDGVLTISGFGDIEVDYDSAWKDSDDEIKTIIIEDGVTGIGHSAFSGCSNLTSVEIPDTVTSIDDYAFSSCDNLQSFTIPAGVQEIGIGILDSFVNMEREITVAEDNEYFFVDEIGVLYSKDKSTLVLAFNNLSVDYTIPDGVTTIREQAFRYNNITAITIPDSVKYIGNGAFCGCRNLTSVTIPDSVISIGYEAFGDCDGLTKLTIPGSVTSAEFGFFNSSDNLTEVWFEGSSPFDGIYHGLGEGYGITVYYPSGDPTWEETIENYQDSLTWQAY